MGWMCFLGTVYQRYIWVSPLTDNMHHFFALLGHPLPATSMLLNIKLKKGTRATWFNFLGTKISTLHFLHYLSLLTTIFFKSTTKPMKAELIPLLTTKLVPSFWLLMFPLTNAMARRYTISIMQQGFAYHQLQRGTKIQCLMRKVLESTKASYMRSVHE